MSRTYRVVQWSTGHVGKHAIAGIDARPDLELVGVWVSNPDKVGKDAGELAGLGRTLGVAATNDADALLALKPDCIVHTAWADTRLFEALADLAKFLRAGINVVSTSPVFLQYPHGDAAAMSADVIAAAHEGGSSIFVNGVDPGFGNDALPLVMTGISERIEQVRCIELLNYATYDQADVLKDIMGFGTPLDETPFILNDGVLTLAWGSVVYQLAAGLDVELDGTEESYERYPAPEDFDIPTGTIPKGTQAALRFEVRGMKDGKAVVVLEHVTRLRDDLAPEWPQPAGQGCYRVIITGEPMYTVDMQLLGTDGDHNTGGLKASAMRIINAVPDVVAAAPGLVTALDLPLITGRGLGPHSLIVSRRGRALSDERVSPTAHYTGYVWARHGLSHPAFVTNEGRALYLAMLPANTASSLSRGPTAEGFLLARHRLLDHLLTTAIDAGEISQVIEVAAGLSPRGWSFTETYGDALTYVETDLPGMADRKRAILTDLGSLTEVHRVVELDAFADDGPQSLPALAAELDPSRGTAIVTEGLVNYFDTPAVIDMWARFARALQRFPVGRYLSDIHLRADANRAVTSAFTLALSAFVRGQVHLHFDTVEAAEAALRDAGFATGEFLRPIDFPAIIGVNPNSSAKRVRVIDASV